MPELYTEYRESKRWVCNHVVTEDGIYLSEEQLPPTYGGAKLVVETVYRVQLMDPGGVTLIFTYSNPLVKDATDAMVLNVQFAVDDVLSLGACPDGERTSAETIVTTLKESTVLTSEQEVVSNQVDNKMSADEPDEQP